MSGQSRLLLVTPVVLGALQACLHIATAHSTEVAVTPTGTSSTISREQLERIPYLAVQRDAYHCRGG